MNAQKDDKRNMMEINEFKDHIQIGLKKSGITSFSDIQREAIPEIFSGKDVFLQAPTGSGKTLAYVIPVLENLSFQGKGKHFPRVLVLVPTRELALQVANVFRSLLETIEGIRTSVLTGGVDIKIQIKQFHNGADIVVATPARLLDHIHRHTFKPKECTTLILDEADQMLEMGFVEDVKEIIPFLPPHQTILLSATYSKKIKELAETVLKDPIVLEHAEEKKLKQNILLQSILVKEERKLDCLKELLAEHVSTIVFCNTKKTCDFVGKRVNCPVIHSDMDYSCRKQIMKEFRENKKGILVATDVVGRGIDVPQVQRVILYDYPDQEEMLVHRIGRCSRDGKESIAYIFLTPNQKEKRKVMDQTFHYGHKMVNYH